MKSLIIIQPKEIIEEFSTAIDQLSCIKIPGASIIPIVLDTLFDTVDVDCSVGKLLNWLFDCEILAEQCSDVNTEILELLLIAFIGNIHAYLLGFGIELHNEQPYQFVELRSGGTVFIRTDA